MQPFRFAIVLFLATFLGSVEASAMPYEQAGWQAELRTRFHGVSGTVTIIDEFTLRVDDFSYDGAGIEVFFWLDDANATEPTFVGGYAVGPQLVRPTPYEDESILLDLGTHSLRGHRAISVWCTIAEVSFGNGFFAPPASVPEPSTALLVALGMASLASRRPRTANS
jgi:Electron transfer DM13/PEP-CTERM motif